MTCFAPIAIVGQACIVPGANSPEELWRLVFTSSVAYGPLPAQRWRANRDRLMLRKADGRADIEGMVSDCAGFVDPTFPSREASAENLEYSGLEPMHAWLLHCGRAALAQARLCGSSRARVGAIVGNLCFPTSGLAAFTESVWLGREAEPKPDPRHRFASGYPIHLLCRRLGLGAGGFALDAACASSLYAIKLAADWLNEGRADAMLAGGVNGADFLGLNLGFTALGALSPTGQSRPFHAEADGLVAAEGAALVVLKRLDDAIKAEDTILGVIRGVGLSNDGSDGGALAPSRDGQLAAVGQAYRLADVDPADVSYLECHATGTKVGDAVEIRGAAQFFEAKRELPIGSLKANLGHLTTAAGAAGLIKLLMALRAGVLPPTPNAFPNNAALEGTRLRVLDRPEEWASRGPRCAAISAFGFGGNNAHLVIEEAPVGARAACKAPRAPSGAVAIVGLGAQIGTSATLDAVRAIIFDLSARTAPKTETIGLPIERLRVPPKDLERALPQHLLMTRVALEAIGAGRKLPKQTAVIVGMGCDASAARTNFRARLPDLAPKADIDATGIAPIDAPTVLGAMANILANRLNSQFDLQGPSYAVAAEEASGLRALDIAIGALRRREVDAALVGAVDLSVDPVHMAAIAAMGGEQTHGAADGACALLLKRREDADRDGDEILACVDDTASDGHRDWRPYQDRHRDAFGIAHAADGLLAVCCAALSLRDGILPPRGTQQPEAPWLSPANDRRARLRLDALASEPLNFDLGGAGARPAPWPGRKPPLVLAYGGKDWTDLERAVASDTPCDPGRLPAGPRFVVVSALSRGEALAHIREFVATRSRGAKPKPLPPGVAFSEGPVEGEVGFVFTGAAAGYAGMGRELLLAYRETIDDLLKDAGGALAWADWMFDSSAVRPPDDFSQLVGSTILCQTHAAFARLIGLKPQAALGLSSGETNALFAFGAWLGLSDLFENIDRCGLYAHRLGGSLDDVRRVWAEQGLGGESWANYVVRATREDVARLVDDEPAVHLLIVHSPREMLIGGESEACQRVVERLGADRAARLHFQFAVHCPEVEACADLWRDLHKRPTRRLDDVRFYFNALGHAGALQEEAVADCLLAQALSTVDFPRTIERAWSDGVRVFVELGPRGECSRWIGETLGDRPHLAVAFDEFGRSSLAQAWHVAATLLAAGVKLDLSPLAAVADAPEIDQRERAFPAHFAPVHIELRRPRPPELPPQIMAPPGPRPLFIASRQSDARAIDAAETCAATLPNGARIHAMLTAAHRDYLACAATAETEFQALVACAVALMTGVNLETTPTAPARTNNPPTLPEPTELPTESRPGLRLDRRQLEALATGRISDIFGPLFRSQDDYARQVRMPAPPLLLVDRVTGLVGEPGTMGLGIIWTETDVTEGAWYLHEGRVPPGIVIEAGQADLLLISWLGADFHNRGERVYRLLGCEMTIFGGLPRAGDTLRYEIHVDGHARAGDTALFFFHYDLHVGGALRMRVRNGQAGFFSDAELAAGQGLLWSAENGEHKPAREARVDPPKVACTKRSFSADEVRACSEGRVAAAFGPGFELTESHTRTPRLQSGRMLLLHEIPVCDPAGGPWGRGYLRGEWSIAPDDWFFEGHFKNDPCMPGTLMLEACVQALSVFMISIGLTLNRDGWRFEPVEDRVYRLRCRSQVTPSAKKLSYEVFVEEVIDGETPMVIADVLGSVDGVGAVHCHGFALRLVPDWPLDERALDALVSEVNPSASHAGHAFDRTSMLACALGPPSRAFGPAYAKLDGPRRVPRLPAPPYLCMDRVIAAPEDIETPRIGAVVTAECDIAEDAWYFSANGARVMPFAILLEAALQPCGWLASYCGFASTAYEELCFRNLDGVATIFREVGPCDGSVTTSATLTDFSRIGSTVIVNFDVRCATAAGPVMDMRTVFGFFPPAALASQVGLPKSEDERAWFSAPALNSVDLSALPADVGAATARLAQAPLLMVDRVTRWEPDGGAKGLGRIRGEKDVRPGEWFFKAHFFQDPVQPGSLGVEALLQLLQAHMVLAGLAKGFANPRFEAIALDCETSWKYRGQVLPTDGKITLLVEIAERHDEAAAIAMVATGSLWVDGTKIYEMRRLGMRIKADDGATAATAASCDERLDLVSAPWLKDHCPTLVLPTIPLAYVADLLTRCAMQARPHSRPTGLRDVAIVRWLPVANPVRLTARVISAAAQDIELELGVAFSPEETPAVVARGVVSFAALGPAPDPIVVEGLAPAVSGASLYETGLLFHGPQLRHLIELQRGQNGAVARLEAASLGAPPGALNVGLLDGMIQIAHDRHAGGWSGATPDHGAFPTSIDSLEIFGDLPLAGHHECRVRASERSGSEPSRLSFHVQLLVDGRVCVDASISYVSIPIGPANDHPLEDQLRFLRQRDAVPGFGLGRRVGDETLVAPADIGPADWLPGTVAAVYDCPGLSGLPLMRAVAAKQHIASLIGVHPGFVRFDADGASCARLPYNRFRIEIAETSEGVRVRDIAPPELDLQPARAFWMARNGGAESVMLTLALEQASRFVRKLELDDPKLTESLRGRATLFLANHQTYQEGASFSALASPLFGAPIKVLVKSEHREGWVGAMDRFAVQESEGARGSSFFYFDRADPDSFFKIIAEFEDLQRQGAHSLLIFVEGTRMRRAGEKVSKISTILPELALKLDVPIAPLRISGGLPLEAGVQKFDFPFDLGRQDHVVGAAIEPEEIARLSLRDRSARLLEAINALPPGPHERPLAGDRDFVEHVRLRASRREPGQTALVKATLIEMLLQARLPHGRVKALAGAFSPSACAPADEWSRRFVEWLNEDERP